MFAYRSARSSARPSPGSRPPRPLWRRTLVAAVALGLVVVPIAAPAFAADRPQPVRPTVPTPPRQLQGGVAGGLSAPFSSFAPVPGRPADPPIGVPFQSLSRAGGALIRVDDQDVPYTSDQNNFAIAVLDRDTRAVVESGTVNRAGTSQLTAIAAKYSGQDNYLMVVSGFKGILADQGNTLAFTMAVKQLGGRSLTDTELGLLRGGAAFSVVGVPGGAAGGAYISIDQGAAPHGNVYGYLQVNVANNLYGVVTAEYPTFDTTNVSTTSVRTTVRFDHKTYPSADLPVGWSGFLILSFDSSLQLLSSDAVPTNGSENDRLMQDTLPGFLTKVTAATPARYGSTVIVRSIGHPTPVGEGWSNAAKIIERLGGNRLAFNNLGRSGVASEYSMVASVANPATTVESSTVLGGKGAVAGTLSRNRDMVFTPVSTGDPSGVNTELVDITYQPAQAFPAFTSGFTGATAAGTAAADAYIGRALRLCADATAQPACSVRTAFYLNYGANFQQASTDLESARMDYPGDGHGFSAADYAAVRHHLGDELSMVNDVRAYFAGLQKPFGEAASTGTIDTKALTDSIVASVDAPRGSGTASFVLGLMGKIVALGSFAGGTTKTVTSGLSAAFGLAAYLTQPSGTPQLAADVKVSAEQLGAQARAQLLATSRSLNGTAMLMISDYGKLKAVADRLPTDTWRLPNDTGPALEAMSTAVKQSAAEKLVPLAYSWLLRGTPERSAQSMSCGFGTTKYVYQVNVWADQPANAALFDPRDYITGDGRSIPAPYWFARGSVMGSNLTPSASLTTMLFAPANAQRGTLGLNLFAFLSPRVFGSIHQANDAAYKCNLS